MEIVTGRPPFAWAESVQYSQSVAAGDLVFTAGQGGFDDAGNVVEGGFEAQVRQTFANVAAALAVHGASLDGIVKLTIYVTDRADYDVFKRVRAELLVPPFPAGTAVQATLLIDGMLFEMDAVAVRGGVRRAQ
jgi:2-iminobutanoate/2-iminopropanoate deaminase